VGVSVASSPMGVRGLLVKLGGSGISEETGCAGLVSGSGSGVTGFTFFLPKPKNPRFDFDFLTGSKVGVSGACLLFSSEVGANVACLDVVPLTPFVRDFSTSLSLTGAGSASLASSSRSVDSASSSPALRGIPRTGVNPDGRVKSSSESESANRL